MDVTPSPRILRMLGEIEFPEWQCIAELLDNAFDDFTEIRRSGAPWPGGFTVAVTLPASGVGLEDAEVVVEDSGRGMTRDNLEKAVKAGWSSNDRLDKLGLFGMGFNVSTARLGTRTRVLTTRPGDLEWSGVEIDFDDLESTFEAKDLSYPKSDLNEHGTRISIGNLKRPHADWFRRNAEQLRQVLGRTYSHILSDQSIELWVAGVRVRPRLHCVWGKDRYVVYGSGSKQVQIPAIIEIDQVFAPADACADCGNWQEVGEGNCRECNSVRVSERERRIHGWVGIQRHLDKREFGIDFLRNGRKILQGDKRVFDWENPNNPVAGRTIEYPVELANSGGRIVGEIHLDHVPVAYSKNAFDYSDRGWRAAMEILRGTGPLLPQSAKKHGFDRNDSPIAKLIEGYRRIDAGRRYLVPGDGQGPIHETTREWAKKFWSGVPEFQSDAKWWEAVEGHEVSKLKGGLDTETPISGDEHDEAAVLAALGLGPSEVAGNSVQDGPIPESKPAEDISETVAQRSERLKYEAKENFGISKSFGFVGVGALDLTVYELSKREVLGEDSQPAPVWLKIESGGSASAFVATQHDLFKRFGLATMDVVLHELVPLLKVRSETKLSHSEILARLKAQNLADSAVDYKTVRNRAQEIINDLRIAMSEQVSDDFQRALQYLSTDERTSVENGVVGDGAILDENVWTSGVFLSYAPPLYLAKLIEGWPEAFMDGKVFRGSYESVNSPVAKRISVSRTVGYVSDLATLLSTQVDPSPAQLHRARWSSVLLRDEIVEQ